MSGKKKIILFSSLIIVTLSLTYVSFVMHNPTLYLITPVLFAFLPCFIMCGVVGGSMWLVPRLSKNKNMSSCGCGMNHSTNKNDTTKISE
jgi:hypothetical protein